MFSEFIYKRIITRIKEMALSVTEIRKNYLKVVDKHTGEINKEIDVLQPLKNCTTMNQLIEQGFYITLDLDNEKSRIGIYLINNNNFTDVICFNFPIDYFDDKEQYLEKYKQECITKSKKTDKDRKKYLKEQEDYKKQLYDRYLKLKKEFENE